MAVAASSSRPISVSAEQRAPIERVTVVGSGLMGSGIAQVHSLSSTLAKCSVGRNSKRD